MLKFIKMHGLGNDFVLIDATQRKVNLYPDLIQKISDRHTGIGFDQLLLIEPSLDKEADFQYRIFNANGQEVEQCGNGARCVARYLFAQNRVARKHLVLATLSGKIELRQEDDNQLCVNMGIPQFQPEKIPFKTEKQALMYTLSLEGREVQFGAVSLGNPHIVMRVDEVLNAPVQSQGYSLQQHWAFPNQVNVGFMEILSPDHIRLRVFERGVGETRACGSGACAAVAIGRCCYGLDARVKVDLPGGRLVIAWTSMDDAIYMTGPATVVFTGEFSAILGE